MNFYKKRKPFISLVCAIALLLSMISVPVDAADTIGVTASTNATVTQGNTAYCYVDIGSTKDLAALDVTVHYDPAKVEILSVYNNLRCTLYDSVTNADNIQFSYILDGNGTAAKTRLFYFQYRVLGNAAPGSAYFDITIGEAYDNSLKDVAVSGSRCNFTITEKTTGKSCSVYGSSSVSTAINREFTLSYQFSTYQIASGTAVITYDPELFEVVTVTEGYLLNGKVVDINTDLTGEIYISFVGTEYYGNYDFLSVTFRTVKNISQTASISFRTPELLNKALDPISCSGCTTRVTVDYDETYVEDAPAMGLDGVFSHEAMQITLVVSLEEASRLGAGDFELTFDPALVSYNSCTKGFAPDFFSIDERAVAEGLLKFHIISLSDILTAETVLTVTFDVIQPYHCESAEFTLDGTGLTDSLTERILLNFVDGAVPLEYQISFCDYDGTLLQTALYRYGDTVLPPEAPFRAEDAYGTYTFAGWDKPVTVCTEEVTYTACYDLAYTDYTVTFVNEDGTELSRATYHWGDPVVAPTVIPTKEADNIYTYSFAGWDKEVASCAGDATYTAEYTPTYIDYTVIFQNYDGTELSRATYHWGESVVAPTVIPTKEADNIYTYSFAGWDQEVVDCAGDATYTAEYTPTYIDYTVIFQNYDGTEISRATYHWGDPVVVPAAPIKESTDTHSYTFAGWGQEVNLTCAGDATYRATYTESIREYTVVFKDADGTVLSEETYHWGDPVFMPADPVKAADNTYTYTFVGWGQVVSATCAGDATYCAVYLPSYIEYTVTFLGEDGAVLSEETYHWGDPVVVPAAPIKELTDTHSYTFAGWDQEVNLTCAGDATYRATYTESIREYTVVFKDADGTVLSEETYHWGDPVFMPVDPNKEADNTYTYSFAGWDQEVVDCAGDATYTAEYNSTYIDYTVIFQNYDGTELSRATYHWGDWIVEPMEVPTKEADNIYTYSFAGWDQEVTHCTGDATYTAEYNSTYIDYTVIFQNYDGTELSRATYHWGAPVTTPRTPSRRSDRIGTYAFSGWDKTVVNCAGDQVYTATYRVEYYYEYYIDFYGDDGDFLSNGFYHWGETVHAPEAPTKASDEEYDYVFAGWTPELSLTCTGDASYEAVFTPVPREYTIIFRDVDGTEIAKETYHWGDPIVAPELPDKEDEVYLYVFGGWYTTPDVCRGDQEFTAVYLKEKREYCVSFYDENGAELSQEIYYWGDPIEIPEPLTKAEDEQYTYVFAGWSPELSITCTGDASYAAAFTSVPREYTIRFCDDDGTLLCEETYHWGDPVVVPEAPTKASDEEYDYIFTGWTPELSLTCTGDASYEAVFTPVLREYTIIFQYADGTLISTGIYHYGDTVAIPEAPESREENLYFAGWDQTVTTCQGDKVYVALFADSIPGDIDQNGVVSTDDVVALLLYISMPDIFPIYVPADFTSDGEITTDDAVALLLHISMPDLFPLTTGSTK